MRERISTRGGQKYKIKTRYLLIAIGTLFGGLGLPYPTHAMDCPDVRVIFARGSGGEQDVSSDYLEFKSRIEEKLKTTDLEYDFIDLEYPAVGVGFSSIDTAMTTLGAYVSGGEAYEFGKSMWKGVASLKAIASDSTCPNTKFVLGGYSQGAMVLLNSLSSFTPDRVIYAATFGDPKIYLPEGAGVLPPACRGDNLSDYRMYVPDCQTYKGILGAYIPYEPDNFIGKIGTWCNKKDILCSSHLSISDHGGYVSAGLYEDASRVIFDKTCKTFGITNAISSPHDTAILIDSTGSMSDWINDYKAEALRLAKETLDAGGRVALYDYRDLDDPYEPVMRCDFETCTIEKFQEGLDAIVADGGGDDSESLLSASVNLMSSLKWQHGATKSVVVLTDADYHSPDRDGTTLSEAVQLSKQIDPVNFYIITSEEYADEYTEFARLTDGKVVTGFDKLELLTDFILDRFDSLPRVEETEPIELPTIVIDELSYADGTGTATVKYHSSTDKALVVLDDAILGVNEGDTLVIDDLINAPANLLKLIPISDDVKGEPVAVSLFRCHGKGYCPENGSVVIQGELILDGFGDVDFVVPKAPNTGRL